MTSTKKTDSQHKRTDNKSEDETMKEKAGAEQKSSHDAMSRQRAGTHEGAGGGAKQKQKH
jgi:hypothetical protein